jgi:glyoxylase-like metal-dependent hydrolase (beta-lactamase superfamily II)
LVEPDIYYMGYASADSFGAASWLIRRPAGNVLVDSPRASRPLMDRLAALGGVRWMFLTHRDDVADHEVFRRRFGCERVLHRADLARGTRDVERLLDGEEPIALDAELTAVPVPGHTRGSTALWFRDALFTGDHLAGEADGDPHAWPEVCWYSWAEQTRSMERLCAIDFRVVLPGHGRRLAESSTEAMRARLRRLVARMRRA